MTDKLVKAKSEKFTKVFLDKWGHYESFLLYNPIRNEVDTAYIAQELWNAGKTILYPKVSGDKLLFGQCTCAADFKEGAMGIMEPRVCSEINTAQVAAIPGLAFDRDNYRLGYGKGYYDRFLATAQIDVKVGLAYEWQLVEDVFRCEHDQPVDTVIFA